jgi:hypothetical protein
MLRRISRKPHAPRPADAPTDADVERGLKAIYRPEPGEAQDFSALQPRVSHRWAIALGVFVLVGGGLAAAIWAGVLTRRPWFADMAEARIDVDLQGPADVAVGEETTYTVSWRNPFDRPLADAKVRINLPPDFEPTALDPRPAGGDTEWTLGDIAARGFGRMTVRGVFSGAVGGSGAVQVVGSVRPERGGDSVEAVDTVRVQYARSVLSGTASIPEPVVAGDRSLLSYEIRNDGVAPLAGLHAFVKLPGGFVVDASAVSGTSAFVDVDGGRAVRFALPEIAPGKTATVSVPGVFPAGSAGDAVLDASAGRLAVDGHLIPMQKASASVAVLGGDLSLKLVVNGSDRPRSAVFGERLQVALGYQNLSPETLRDVRFGIQAVPLESATRTTATAAAMLVDWMRIEGPSGTRPMPLQAAWAKGSPGWVDRLFAQQDGILEFVLPVAGPASSTASAFRLQADATLVLASSTRTVRSAPVDVAVVSDVALGAEARYFSEEGAPIGKGPLPPVVGQPTEYVVTWSLAKKVHGLRGVRVSAVLPKNVAFVEAATTTAGMVATRDGSVVWDLTEFRASETSAEASFRIRLTPEAGDAARFAALLGTAELVARDADADWDVARRASALTTDLSNDESARGKGVVKR